MPLQSPLNIDIYGFDAKCILSCKETRTCVCVQQWRQFHMDRVHVCSIACHNYLLMHVEDANALSNRFRCEDVLYMQV